MKENKWEKEDTNEQIQETCVIITNLKTPMKTKYSKVSLWTKMRIFDSLEAVLYQEVDRSCE